MNRDRFESWLDHIGATQEEEISCSECFDLVSHYVELELAGDDAAVELPQLRQHLDQCATCRQEYEILRDLRRLEEEDRAPTLDELQNLLD